MNGQEVQDLVSQYGVVLFQENYTADAYEDMRHDYTDK